MAQAAARKLRDRDAKGGNEGCERQRNLIANATGGVLVRGLLGQGLKAHRLTGGNHRLGPLRDFLAIHAVEEDRHVECGHLLIAHDPASIGIDDPVDFLRAKHSLIALGANNIYRIEFLGHDDSSCTDLETETYKHIM